MNRLKYILYSHVPCRVPSNTITTCGNSQWSICNEKTSSLSEVFCTRRLSLLPVSKQNASFRSTTVNSDVSSGSQCTPSPRHAIRCQSGKPFRRRYLRSRLLRNVRSAPATNRTNPEMKRTWESNVGYLCEDSFSERNVSRVDGEEAKSEIYRERRIFEEDLCRSPLNRNVSLDSTIQRPSYRFVQVATMTGSRDGRLDRPDGKGSRMPKNVGNGGTSIINADLDTQTYAKLISKYVDTLDAINPNIYRYERFKRREPTRPSSDYLAAVSSFMKTKRNEKSGSSLDTKSPSTISGHDGEIVVVPYRFSNLTRYSEPPRKRKDNPDYSKANGPNRSWETANDVDEAKVLEFIGERAEWTDSVAGANKTGKMASSRSVVKSEFVKHYSEGRYHHLDGEDEQIGKMRLRKVVEKKRSLDDVDFSRKKVSNEGNESDVKSRSYVTECSLEYLISDDGKPRVTVKMRPGTSNVASNTSKVELRMVPADSEAVVSVNVNAKTMEQSNLLKSNASNVSIVVRSEHPDDTTMQRRSSSGSSSKVSKGSKVSRDSQEQAVESEFMRITIDDGQSTVSTQTSLKHVEFRINDEVLAELKSETTTDSTAAVKTKLNVVSSVGKVEILIPGTSRSTLSEKEERSLEKALQKTKSTVNLKVSAKLEQPGTGIAKNVERPVGTEAKSNLPNQHFRKIRDDPRFTSSGSKRTTLSGSSIGRKVETVETASNDSSEGVDGKKLSREGVRSAVGSGSSVNFGPKGKTRDSSLDDSKCTGKNTKIHSSLFETNQSKMKLKRDDRNEDSPASPAGLGDKAWQKSATIVDKKGKTQGTKEDTFARKFASRDAKVSSTVNEVGGVRKVGRIGAASKVSSSGSKHIIKDSSREPDTSRSAIQKKGKWFSGSFDNGKVTSANTQKIRSQERVGVVTDGKNNKASIDDPVRSRLKKGRKRTPSLTEIIKNELKKKTEQISDPKMHNVMPRGTFKSSATSKIEKANIKIKTDLLTLADITRPKVTKSSKRLPAVSEDPKTGMQKKDGTPQIKNAATKPEEASKAEGSRAISKVQKTINAPIIEQIESKLRQSAKATAKAQLERKVPGSPVSSATTKSRAEEKAKSATSTFLKPSQSKAGNKVRSESATTKKDKYDYPKVSSAASGSKLQMNPKVARIEVRKKMDDSAVFPEASKVIKHERQKSPTGSGPTKRIVIKRNRDGTLVDYVDIKDVNAAPRFATKAPKSETKINHNGNNTDANKSLRLKPAVERKAVKSETKIVKTESSDRARVLSELKAAISDVKKKNEEPTKPAKTTSRSKVTSFSGSETKSQINKKSNDYPIEHGRLKIKTTGSKAVTNPNDKKTDKRDFTSSKTFNNYGNLMYIKPALEKRKDGTLIDYGAKVTSRNKLEVSSGTKDSNKINSAAGTLRYSKSASGFKMTITPMKKMRDTFHDVTKAEKHESSNMTSGAGIKKIGLKDSLKLPRAESATEKRRIESYQRIESPSKTTGISRKIEETTKKKATQAREKIESHVDSKRSNEIVDGKKANYLINSAFGASTIKSSSASFAASKTSNYPVLPEHLRFLLRKKTKDTSDTVQQLKKSEKSLKTESNPLKPPKYKEIEARTKVARITSDDPVPVQTGSPRLKDFEEDHIFSGPERRQLNLKNNRCLGAAGSSNLGDSKPEGSPKRNPEKKNTAEKSDSNFRLPTIKSSRSMRKYAARLEQAAMLKEGITIAQTNDTMIDEIGILKDTTAKGEPDDMKTYGTRSGTLHDRLMVHVKDSNDTQFKCTTKNREFVYFETGHSNSPETPRRTMTRDQSERPEKSLLYSCWLQRFETKLIEDRRKT